MALALNLEHRQQAVEAEKLLRGLVTQFEQQKPPPAAPRVEALTLLAELLLRDHRPADAEAPARQAVDLSRKSSGEGHWQTALAENALGESLAAQKRYADAEPLLVSSLGILQIHAGPRSGLVRQALKRVIAMYQGWDKPEQAKQWQQQLAREEAPPDKTPAVEKRADEKPASATPKK
jgi:non-specific serine/threonine protein kinase/serine/threonine-protein kinase